MLFSSISFFYYFFAIVLAIYFIVPFKIKLFGIKRKGEYLYFEAKNFVLLIASLFFYFYGEPIYTFLMIGTILVNYIAGILIDKFRGQFLSKLFLWISVALSLGSLGFFKYSGFIADKAGRKTTVTLFSVTCVTGYILFVAGILCGWNPYLVGALAGLYQGSYWIGRDYMNVMMTEKVPTDIRASVVGAEGLLVIIGLVVGYGLTIVGMMIMPIWWACLAVSVPMVSIAAVMFARKVKETKGANLDAIE